jgi:secreted trypsin-like serine protease
MTTSRLIRAPLWATLLIALVAAMVSLFVFVPNSEAAPAADGKYSPYIINGEPVPNGKYPFMSWLTMSFADDPGDSDNRPQVAYCGGTLIDADSVLTAGHCVTGDTRLLKVKLTVGRTVRGSNQGQVRSVKSWFIHPKYKSPRGLPAPYDAAVLELSRPVSGIKPIELATSSQNNLERPGRHATLAGWGDVLNDNNPNTHRLPHRLQEARLPIVSDSRAEEVFKTQYFPPLMIAAGGEQSNQCSGDSGGPLFVRTSGNGDGDNGDDENSRDTNGGSGGKYTQIGIVSYGPDPCLSQSKLGVYTEVNAKPIASFIDRAADNGDDDDGDNGGDE